MSQQRRRQCGELHDKVCPHIGGGPNLSTLWHNRWVPQVLALREGKPLPEGYTLVVQAPATSIGALKSMETVALTTPPESAALTSREDLETSNCKTTERRNATRSANKQTNASLARGKATGNECQRGANTPEGTMARHYKRGSVQNS